MRMRKSKFTESEIVAILAEGDAGLPVAEVCRKHGPKLSNPGGQGL
jgi:putative transposase